MDDEDEKILPTDASDGAPSGRGSSASTHPLTEEATSGAAPTPSSSQERLNISPNEQRDSRSALNKSASSSSNAGDASLGRSAGVSSGETIVLGTSNPSSSQSSASTTPTASTPGCSTRGTTPTPPITKQPQQHSLSPGGVSVPSSLPAPAPALQTSNSNANASTEVVQEDALAEAARRIEELQSMKDPPFPVQELAKLDDMINRPRWIVPVLPKGELEILLNAAIELCKAGVDSRSEPCQRFFREGLTISFTKILTDDAVHGWKFEIHRCIQRNAEKLIELCVAKLHDDWFPLLELLAIVLNPQSKFHQYNGSRTSETVPPKHNLNDDELFARPLDLRSPRGWLVDLINQFGTMGGFQILLDRFTSGTRLSVPVISALIRPFGLCFELLTPNTVRRYFMPIVELVPSFLDNLTDEELKKEAKNESKNDSVSSIVKYLKNLVTRLPNQEEKAKSLEMFRLKMILRLLQISSFNGKMNALNEINKVITGVSYYTHRHSAVEDDEWLTADRMAEWLQENKVLSIVLRDSLHQPQYVEKLEKILRFVIKEKALTIEDLDALWAAQNGKHEAIVKNVHDLLAKLAWDFASEQLDHLFELFQSSWAVEGTKQREALLELIRRLAEDDKDGIMAHKVLGLLWSLAHSDDAPTDLMDQALLAHVKILDYSCSQDRDTQKMTWINKFVDELRNDKWVIPALKQIKEICSLFTEAPQNYGQSVQRSPHVSYRHEVISQLQNTHSLVTLVAENLTTYMNRARHYHMDNPQALPEDVLPDGRYNHIQQVQERLNFLRFLLKDGQLWLCAPQARQIWTCLAENAVYNTDREACFKWFSKLMGDEPDLDPDINRDFFENNILQLDPVYLTESGIKCFERFFKAVNAKEQKLIQKRRAHMMDDLELIGLNYIWRVVIASQEEVAEKAISLLKEIYTNLGPRLQPNQVDIHEDFVASCMDRLKACYDTVTILSKDKEIDYINQETVSIVRVLTVLHEYISECDDDYHEERAILPLGRACRGKHFTLIVRFPNQGRQFDDIELWSHANETVGSIRRQILTRLKANATHVKVDLFINGDAIDMNDDKKLISQVLTDVFSHGPNSNKALITAKLSQAGSNMPSSPDSSSDSSTAGSPRNTYDGPNAEAEKCLPGVIMAANSRYATFLFQLADLGSQLQIPKVREGAMALLKLMPADMKTVENLKSVCSEPYLPVDPGSSTQMEALFFCSSPSQALYHLEVTYLLLMPALNPLSEEAFEFQRAFMRSGGVSAILTMITRNNYLVSADLSIRRQAYLIILKIAKILLSAVGHAMVQVVAEAVTAVDSAQHHSGGGNVSASINISPAQHGRAVVLQQALHQMPSPSSEMMLRSVVSRLGQSLSDSVTDVLPDLNAVKAIVKLAWASASGSLHLLQASNDDIHKTYENLPSDGMTTSWGSTTSGQHEPINNNLAKESLEVLTICLALCPDILDQLTSKGDKSWQCFIVDMILLCNSRTVRASASEQLYLIATKSGAEKRPLLFFITLLFTVLDTTVKENAKQSHEYFQILCKLLSYACQSKVSVPTNINQLNKEVEWLGKVRNTVIQTGVTGVEEALLEGHLGVTKELLSFQTSELKYKIGSDPEGHQLIKQLVEDFIFPASKIVLQCRKSDGELPDDHAIPVCSTPLTITAAFELLVSLCTGCVANLRMLAELLTDMYFNGSQAVLNEWEYLPPVGPRPHNGFVGLKNAGATCYMNSVLQQLFMIDEIRTGILQVEGAVQDFDEDLSGDERDDKEENEDKEEIRSERNTTEERKEYNLGVLKHVQMIFGHLATSKLQFYVPKGFWRHFKLWGEPVNLREQHDALEFFNSLVDSLDEALKLVKQPAILSKIMGGSFADQKICKGCPHRYSREESFTTLNVDIRNHHDLLSSLEQYVKGDLLEGANAYHCEKCDKKVDTVKRLCIKKLPPYLAIQLKRFDYDWEHETAIKFNDYFEFPKELDMEPYTEKGLSATSMGEWIHDGEPFSIDSGSQSTKYRLVGVVVHSGQASGGHYYSFILHRPAEGSLGLDGKVSNGELKWYKFDDGEVSECKFDDEDEMKNQWFGGEYMGEVFDHMLKRMSCRRQKRWWNAYILFYEQLPGEDELSEGSNDTPASLALAEAFKNLKLDDCPSDISMTTSVIQPPYHPKMPSPIERCVRRKNIQFMHNKTLFSLEFFQFMKKLITCNAPFIQQNTAQPVTTDLSSLETEELAMISIQLASKFLFSVGFHTKKTLRGSASEWYDAIRIHLQCSRNVRSWFANSVLFAHQERFAEYMLECPTSEVRSAFVKIIWFLAHYSLQDGPCSPPNDAPELLGMEHPNATLSDYILSAVLALLKKEVAEHGRTLSQYFHFFYIYANLGVTERLQLLKLGVPVMFMLVALDEGPGPPIKYQYAELGKLYSVVSLLVRCCDVSGVMQSSQPNATPLQNPHGDPTLSAPLMPIQAQVNEILFRRNTYVKKVIEDCNASEETVKLLRFCCWENPHFSSSVLSELLWQVAFSYTYELRPYMDLLYQMLLIDDSWQQHRIHNALKGIPDDRDGLFDTIQKSKNHYQKRAYQCIKMMVNLFSNCTPASNMLHSQGDLKRKWTWAVEWLNDELDRRPYTGNVQYANNWNPPVQSNETSNGYYLERSQSARMTLARAFELCAEEDGEGAISEGSSRGPPESTDFVGSDNEVEGGATGGVVGSSQQAQQETLIPSPTGGNSTLRNSTSSIGINEQRGNGNEQPGHNQKHAHSTSPCHQSSSTNIID